MTKKELKKLEIIKTGFFLMKSKGYNGTGINEIIHTVGIPKGSFYYYFESKEGFAIEILNYYADRLLQNVADALTDPSQPPLQRILKLYKRQVADYLDNSSFSYGAFGTRLCQEIGSRHTLVKNAAEKVYKDLIGLHNQCLLEASAKGDIGRDIDTAKLSEFIIYSWEGALMRLNGSKNADSLQTFNDMLQDVVLKRA